MEAAEKDGNFRVTSLHVCNQKNKKKGKTRRAFFPRRNAEIFVLFLFWRLLFNDRRFLPQL